MRKPQTYISIFSALFVCLISLVGLGIVATPSMSKTKFDAAPRTDPSSGLIHVVHAIPAATLAAAPQDAGQATPPAAAAPSGAKPVVMPEGDGKPIAEEFCQECHRLTNLIKAHKNLDDWKDTIHTMIDRGASIPDDKIDTLAQYLAKNFGPKDSVPAGNSPASSSVPAAPAPSQDAAGPSSPAPANAVVELPAGDGKAIATQNCQACHKLTNLTKAHKSLDDWKDTVQTMIDRGANVQPEQVDTLVQYLAKNFGPKDATPSAPAVAPPAQ